MSRVEPSVSDVLRGCAMTPGQEADVERPQRAAASSRWRRQEAEGDPRIRWPWWTVRGARRRFRSLSPDRLTHR